jgi:hypothetical protein
MSTVPMSRIRAGTDRNVDFCVPIIPKREPVHFDIVGGQRFVEGIDDRRDREKPVSTPDGAICQNSISMRS